MKPDMGWVVLNVDDNWGCTRSTTPLKEYVIDAAVAGVTAMLTPRSMLAVKASIGKT
jgi:hypothetical protein